MCWPSGLRAWEAGDTKRSKIKNNKNKRELDNDTEAVSYKEGRRKSKRRIAGTEGTPCVCDAAHASQTITGAK